MEEMEAQPPPLPRYKKRQCEAGGIGSSVKFPRVESGSVPNSNSSPTSALPVSNITTPRIISLEHFRFNFRFVFVFVGPDSCEYEWRGGGSCEYEHEHKSESRCRSLGLYEPSVYKYGVYVDIIT